MRSRANDIATASAVYVERESGSLDVETWSWITTTAAAALRRRFPFLSHRCVFRYNRENWWTRLNADVSGFVRAVGSEQGRRPIETALRPSSGQKRVVSARLRAPLFPVRLGPRKRDGDKRAVTIIFTANSLGSGGQDPLPATCSPVLPRWRKKNEKNGTRRKSTRKGQNP